MQCKIRIITISLVITMVGWLVVGKCIRPVKSPFETVFMGIWLIQMNEEIDCSDGSSVHVCVIKQ